MILLIWALKVSLLSMRMLSWVLSGGYGNPNPEDMDNNYYYHCIIN